MWYMMQNSYMEIENCLESQALLTIPRLSMIGSGDSHWAGNTTAALDTSKIRHFRIISDLESLHCIRSCFDSVREFTNAATPDLFFEWRDGSTANDSRQTELPMRPDDSHCAGNTLDSALTSSLELKSPYCQKLTFPCFLITSLCHPRWNKN